MLANIYGSNFSDDLEHYHYGSITNSDEMKVIWGNSFLHPAYGTTSLWLTGHSYFNFDHSRLIDIHVLNGLILFLILSLFLSEINFNKKSDSFFNKLVFSILLFILIKYTRLKEFGIDRPATLLFCFLIYYYYKFFITLKNKDFINNFIILFLISIIIISIKIIYLPILTISILIFFTNRKKIMNRKYQLIFIIIPVLIFLLKNIFSSGCLIFPLEFTCLKFLSWSNHLGSSEFSSMSELINKSWNSYSGNLSQFDYIKDFNWFSTSFERGKIEILEYFFTIFLVILATYLTYRNSAFKKQIINLDILRISLFFIVIFSLVIYFFKNPVLRMNHHLLISLMIFLISFLRSNNQIIKKKNYLVNFFLIFAFIFAFQKNFVRIKDNNFVNNPLMIISNKIAEPRQKEIDNFEYFIGWYGSAPIGNQDISNKKHVKFLIFDIISNKNYK